MKMPVFTALLTAILILEAGSVQAADKQDKGGLLGNSYSSEMQTINQSSFLLTTRKNVTGDLNEINIHGTKVFNAFEQVKAATLLRAAIEARNLGYSYFSVSGSRNLTNVREKRSSSKNMGGGAPENAFIFAYGHYTNDVELIVEFTVQLSNEVQGQSSEANVNVEVVLRAACLSGSGQNKSRPVTSAG